MRSNLLTLNTVAFELVPPNADLGREQALEEARKVLRFSKETGIDGRIGHVMMPGMIEEDDDRPVEMKPRLDVLDFWKIIEPRAARGEGAVHPGHRLHGRAVTAPPADRSARRRNRGHRFRRRAAHHERR